MIQTTQPQDVIEKHIDLPHPTNHPDVIWINPDRSGLTIDLVREVQASVLIRPYQADYKVYVIYDLEKSTLEAQQALLKLLEEPPAHVHFLLTSEYPTMVLPTILSRVVLLKSQITASEDQDQLDHLLSLSLSQALDWLEQFKTQEDAMTLTTKLLRQSAKKLERTPSLALVDQTKVFQKVLEMLGQKANIKLTLEWMVLKLKK